MRGRFVFLSIFAAAIFLLMVGRRQFAASHEARVADPAREMAAAGFPWNARTIEVPAVHLVKRMGVLRLTSDPDAPALHVDPWIVPVLTGEIRLQKPPLPYWCAAVAYRIWGVSEMTSRLVPALLGAMAVFLLYDLARILYGGRVAWAASLFWLSSYLVPEEYRLAMADPYLAFFTLAALWAWVRTTGAVATLHVLLFYAFLALGALAKGPLIFLHVFVPVLLFHLLFGRRLPRAWLTHAIGIIFFALIALPWPMAVLRQVPNAIPMWRYESIGEISGENQEGLRTWWYYVQALPQMAVPWVAIWLFALAYPFLGKRRWAAAIRGALYSRVPSDRPLVTDDVGLLDQPVREFPKLLPAAARAIVTIMRQRSKHLFPLAWYALIVLIFSAVGQKKLPYLLPIMPAQALMLAVATVPLIRLAGRMRMRKLPGAIVAVQTIIGIGWALSLPVLLWHEHDLKAVPITLFVIAFALAAIAFHEMRSVRPMRWLLTQSITYGLIIIVFCDYYLTDLNNARSPVALCHELESKADGTHVALLVSKMPEQVAFYLPLHPRTGPAPTSYLVVVDDQAGAESRAKSKRPAPTVKPQQFAGWVPDAKVVDAKRLEMTAAPGDSRWKVYELTVERKGFAAVTPPPF